MGHKIEVEYTHLKDADRPDDPEVECTDLIIWDIFYEGPDYSVGLYGGWFLDEDAMPEKCKECGHLYTEAEREEIGNLADKQVSDYDPEPDPR